MDSDDERLEGLNNMKSRNWHCASIAWEAFYLAAGVDIDENRGFLVFPADIVASHYFDGKGQRVRF